MRMEAYSRQSASLLSPNIGQRMCRWSGKGLKFAQVTAAWLFHAVLDAANWWVANIFV